MTNKEISVNDICKNIHGFNSVSNKDGVWLFKRDFGNYAGGVESFAAGILESLTTAFPGTEWAVLATGQTNRAFRNGDCGSFTWAKIAMIEQRKRTPESTLTDLQVCFIQTKGGERLRAYWCARTKCWRSGPQGADRHYLRERGGDVVDYTPMPVA